MTPSNSHHRIWRPYTQMLDARPPLKIARAEGVYLYTEDGRRILDAISSWWVNIHGHNHPRLNRAIAQQAERVAQVIFANFTHEPAERLADELIARTPDGLNHVFYSDNGSTAVEVALKMVYQYWRNRGERGRTRFATLDGAYHGDTLGAMAVSGPSPFQAEFQDLMPEVVRIPHPERDARGLGAVTEIIERHASRLAGVIIEPMVQGAAGMVMWPPEFLRTIRRTTQTHGLPLIADEVFTGFGRTGKMFACEHGPITPDVMCLSKGLTGGYLPLGATLCSTEIFESFLDADRSRTLFHGHSFTGNALSCAVALESLALLDENRCLDRVARMELQVSERLGRLAAHPRVLKTRGIGGLAVIEIVPDGPAGYMDATGPKLHAAFLERDVLLRPLGNTLYVLPPYVISDAEIDLILDSVEEVLRDVLD